MTRATLRRWFWPILVLAPMAIVLLDGLKISISQSSSAEFEDNGIKFHYEIEWIQKPIITLSAQRSTDMVSLQFEVVDMPDYAIVHIYRADNGAGVLALSHGGAYHMNLIQKKVEAVCDEKINLANSDYIGEFQVANYSQANHRGDAVFVKMPPPQNFESAYCR